MKNIMYLKRRKKVNVIQNQPTTKIVLENQRESDVYESEEEDGETYE